jgi:hypothetical protein
MVISSRGLRVYGIENSKKKGRGAKKDLKWLLSLFITLVMEPRGILKRGRVYDLRSPDWP